MAVWSDVKIPPDGQQNGLPPRTRSRATEVGSEIVRRTIGTERWHVAAAIHDSMIQLLVASLQRIRLAERTAGTDTPLGEFLADARRFTESAVKAGRGIIEDLVSRPARRSILEVRVSETLRRLEQEGHAVAVHVGPLPDLSPFPKLEQSLAGVIGEAVTNGVRHSGAFNIWVEVATADDIVTVTVRDDGSGFDVARAERLGTLNRHFGLYLIREWARFGGGWGDIYSTPGVGTTVSAYLPTGAPLNGEAASEDEPGLA